MKGITYYITSGYPRALQRDLRILTEKYCWSIFVCFLFLLIGCVFFFRQNNEEYVFIKWAAFVRWLLRKNGKNFFCCLLGQQPTGRRRQGRGSFLFFFANSRLDTCDVWRPSNQDLTVNMRRWRGELWCKLYSNYDLVGTNYIGIRDIQPKNQHDNTKENLSSLDFGAGDGRGFTNNRNQ